MRYKHIISDIDGTMLNAESAEMFAMQETVFQPTEEKNISTCLGYFSA